MRARSLVGACCELLSLHGGHARSSNYRRFAQGLRYALGAGWEPAAC